MNMRLAEMWGSEVHVHVAGRDVLRHREAGQAIFRNGQPDGLTSTFERPCQHTASELNPLVQPPPTPASHPHPSTPSSLLSPFFFPVYEFQATISSVLVLVELVIQRTVGRRLIMKEVAASVVDFTAMIQTQKGK